MASLPFTPLSSSIYTSTVPTLPVFASTSKLPQHELTQLTFSPCSSKSNPILRTRASRMPPDMTIRAQNTKRQVREEETANGSNPFSDMKERFLQFKREKYLANSERFQILARDQAPKFTVIACVDSRVCPSTILGLEPGEAFMVRNVANLVPPYESGPSETKAALEFSVNTLLVENIMVIGHSCCGGIQALMSMRDEEDSRSFIRDWVTLAKNAKLRTKSVASHLSFNQQCQHCEKESIKGSLMNLLTYPWIKDRVAKGTLSLHGGYYDFTNCTFEKWTLDYEGMKSKDAYGNTYCIKDGEYWQ